MINPSDENLSLGTPTIHPTNKDPFVGAPMIHPTNKDPFVGAPMTPRRAQKKLVQSMVPFHARNMHTLIAKKVVLPLEESLIILDRARPAQTREAAGRPEIEPSSKNFLPPSCGFVQT
jgi:hypothetical protein